MRDSTQKIFPYSNLPPPSVLRQNGFFKKTTQNVNEIFLCVDLKLWNNIT